MQKQDVNFLFNGSCLQLLENDTSKFSPFGLYEILHATPRVQELMKLTWNDLLQFPLEESFLHEDNRIPSHELNTSHILRAYKLAQNGEEVFLKIVETTTRHTLSSQSLVMQEATWAQLFSEEGVGPKFKGVFITSNDSHGIAYQYVLGKHFHILPRFSRYYHTNFSNIIAYISEYTLRDAQKIREVVERQKIAPDDMQVRITPEGRLFVIDTALFTSVMVQNGLEDYSLREIDLFIEEVKHYLE